MKVDLYDYSVYWIHLPEVHTNPLNDGYIGISKDYKKRFKDHYAEIKHHPHYKLSRALNKYKDIDIMVLHSGFTQDEALIIENIYRPLEKIGWNIAKGGGMPPSPKGKTLSSEHKLKISKSMEGKNKGRPSWNKGIPRSAKTKLKISKKNKGKTLSSEHKLKISKKNKGHIVTEETKLKIGKGNKGKLKGKTYEEIYGKERAEEQKKKRNNYK